MSAAHAFNRAERRTAVAICAAVALLAAAFLLVPSVDADDAYDGEFDFYGYTIVMGLQNPSGVVYAEWDFGDGSEKVRIDVTEENPTAETEHTFTDKGDYTVVVTGYNPDATDKQEHTERFLFHIHGYPIVTFVSNGGTPVESIQGTSPSYVAERPADPANGDLVFTGWYTDPECTQPYDWSSVVREHITLYAGWSAQTLTVIFDPNGADMERWEVKVDYGSTIEEPENPARTGFVFLGWQVNGVLWDFNDPVTGDMTLVAQWADASVTEYYVVTFDPNGGTSGYTTVNVIAGNAVVLPTAERDGYTLEGWYSGDTRIGVAGDSYFPEGNVTLTAHWTEDDDGGLLWLILAIVFAVIALICLVAFFLGCGWLPIVGTILFAAASAVCALIHVGVIAL